MLKLIALITLAATKVAAHGYVQELTLGTEKYTGYLPYSDKYVGTSPHVSICMMPNAVPQPPESSPCSHHQENP